MTSQNLSAIGVEYVAGASMTQLAIRHGVDRETIRRQLHDIGAPIRPAHRPARPNPIPAELVYMRQAAGVSQRAMAEVLGVHHSTISLWERGVHAPLEATLVRWREVCEAAAAGSPAAAQLVAALSHRVDCAAGRCCRATRPAPSDYSPAVCSIDKETD